MRIVRLEKGVVAYFYDVPEAKTLEEAVEIQEKEGWASFERSEVVEATEVEMVTEEEYLRNEWDYFPKRRLKTGG